MPIEQKEPRALILGGSSQLALMLLAPLLDRKIHPIVTYRSDEGKGRIAEASGPDASRIDLLHLDFSQENTLKNLNQRLSPAPDYLVDFAHSDYESLVGGADLEKVRSYFQTNVVFRSAVLKQVSRAMLSRRRGRLVYVSSTAAAAPGPGQGFYAAAKLAAEALYRNLGMEMAAKGITTAVVRPGYVPTGRGRRFLERSDQMVGKFKKVGHIVSPQEVVAGIVYLLLEAGPGANATTLTIDGGMTATK